jgi:hypothetical protein
MTSDRVYSARDVQDVAGLSYRQINDWDSRGILPSSQEGDGAWRRFSPRDIFVLLVVNELHTKFGIPLQRLQFVREFMLQPGADHLRAAVDMMAMLGIGVWLLTDLESTFIMHSELEFLDLMKHQYFGGERDASYVFVKVNPLVNRILGALDEPMQLRSHGRGYEIVKELRERFGVRSAAEYRILQAIRSGDFRKVEVTMSDGAVATMRTTADRPTTSSIEDLLRDGDYQRLTLTQRNGSVVVVEQQLTEKLDEIEFRSAEEAPHDAD